MSGVVFTPAAADRIGRATRWVEAQRHAGREPAGPGRGVEPVWARVTSGTADGDGYYPGVITLRAGDDGSWSDYSAVKVGPLNGETLSDATRYAVRPSGRTSAGDELYTVIGATVVAGAIAVEAADGTPAYASVTKVTLDQADGFSLTNPAPGVVRLDLAAASDTQVGVVTTDLQTFGGRKTFLNAAVFQGQTANTTQEMWAGRACYHAGYGWGLTIKDIVGGNEGGIYGIDSGTGLTGITIHTRSTSHPGGTIFDINPGGTADFNLLDADGNVSDDDGGAVFRVHGRFGATDPLTDEGGMPMSGEGDSGYLADGTKVVGGIVTIVGSGTIDGGTW